MDVVRGSSFALPGRRSFVVALQARLSTRRAWRSRFVTFHFPASTCDAGEGHAARCDVLGSGLAIDGGRDGDRQLLTGRTRGAYSRVAIPDSWRHLDFLLDHVIRSHEIEADTGHVVRRIHVRYLEVVNSYRSLGEAEGCRHVRSGSASTESFTCQTRLALGKVKTFIRRLVKRKTVLCFHCYAHIPSTLSTHPCHGPRFHPKKEGLLRPPRLIRHTHRQRHLSMFHISHPQPYRAFHCPSHFPFVQLV